MVRVKRTTVNRKGMIWLLSVIPFVLNDFSNIHAASYEQWVLVDYACRVAVLVFLGALVFRGSLKGVDLGLSWERPGKLAYWTLILAGMVISWEMASRTLRAPLEDVWKLSTVRYDRESALFALDMTLGLGLVAVSEEIVFRGLALSALHPRIRNPLGMLVVSALVFALIHWSTGLRNILDCFAFGLLFMAVTMRARSIIPATVVHYALDYFLLARA